MPHTRPARGSYDSDLVLWNAESRQLNLEINSSQGGKGAPQVQSRVPLRIDVMVDNDKTTPRRKQWRQVMRRSHPKRRIAILFAALLSLGAAVAAVNEVTPSTNDENKVAGWAHVNQLMTGPGFVTLEFVSTRGFLSCFEFRTDGDTSQVLPDNGGNNYNPAITDGLYPFTCESNSTSMKTLFADEYVEVRMVFGAEGDERFDWTRFDVGGKELCKDGGWQQFGFRNQGQCIRFANTGMDSR